MNPGNRKRLLLQADRQQIASTGKSHPRFGRDRTRANTVQRAKIEKSSQIEYAEKQKEAIKTAVNKGILILTGGPGTGKTTTLNGIINMFEKDYLDIALCAPTGRAASSAAPE